MDQVLGLFESVQNLFGALPWRQIFPALFILLVFLAARYFLVKFVLKKMIEFSSATGTGFHVYLTAFEKPFKILFIILGLYCSLAVLAPTPAHHLLLLKLLRSALVFLLAWGFYELSSQASILEGISQKLDFKIDQILAPFIRKIFRFLIVAFALIIIAQEWQYNVSGFIAGLGLGGLAVALAAKDLLANIFGGFVIITDKPFSIGDWIYTPSVEGIVEDMSFRSTRLRTFANALVIVPNSVLANEPVTNWSRMGKRRVSFRLGVIHDTAKEQLENCLAKIREMLKNDPDVHPETIYVSFDGFSEHGLTVLIYYFTRTIIYKEFLAAKQAINFRIMEILEQENVALALPSRTVYLQKGTD